MCGRYTLSVAHEALARAFLAEFSDEVKQSLNPRYNIAPGGGIVAVLEDRDKGGRRGEVLQWGLVPGWARDPAISARLTNARSETLFEKPAFRDAIRYRRCLVPASGFYEWDRSRSPRQPWYFHPVGVDFMAIAGIWEYWLHPSGSEILSVALITRPADAVVGEIHDRMPLVLPANTWQAWLSTTDPRPDLPGLQVAQDSRIRFLSHPVSTAVNKTGSQAASLIDPIVLKPPDPAQLDLFDHPGG